MIDRLTEALGLGRAVGPLTPYAHTSQPTWTLDTVDGRVFVKQAADGAERAMAFEAQAAAAGIATPRMIGGIVDVGGLGRVRAHEWIDGRPLADDDAVEDWLGETLTRLHALRPLEHADPEWYGVEPEQRWRGWLAEGLSQNRIWAPTLRDNLGALLTESARVERAFRAAADPVFTHRDVEPWNILITRDGPVLLDWDGAGPDSASLEAAQVALVSALRGRSTPDPQKIKTFLRAYGGSPAAGPDAFARRLGMRLNRLSWRLRISVGEHPPAAPDQASSGQAPTGQALADQALADQALAGRAPADQGAADRRAAEQIAGLAEFAEQLRRWSGLLGTGHEAPPTATA